MKHVITLGIIFILVVGCQTIVVDDTPQPPALPAEEITGDDERSILPDDLEDNNVPAPPALPED